VLPEKINDYNSLEDAVTQVTPVTPKNDSKVQKSDPVSARKKLRLAIAETTGIRNRFASVAIVANTLTIALAAMSEGNSSD
jgi:hypothetical protein